MKYTVVLTAEYPPIAREILAGEFDVIEHPTEPERTEDDVITILSEADAAITLLSDPLTRRVLTSNPKFANDRELRSRLQQRRHRGGPRARNHDHQYARRA